MGLVKFGDYVKEVKINIDRNNNPYEYYVAGDHMDSEDLTIRRKGLFATDDVGPAFTRLFKPGQILYGSRRTYLKKVAVADFEGICSNTTFVLETKDENKLRQRLLPFIMLTDDFTKWSISKSKGSTNPYILFSDLANYEFELPDISRQDELVNLLWQAYATKESYREMIRATDEMVKSQFISQFGFPQDGAEKYPSATIESLLQETISGEWGSDCSDDSGTKVIRTTNFTNEGVLDLTDVVVRTIDAKKVEKKQLKKGDIILEKSGGTKDNPVGRLVYFEEEGVFLANNFTQVLRPAEDINSRYLFAALYYLYQTHKPLIKGLGNQTNGIQNLKVPQYLQLQISVPDRTAQDDFERICRQADKSKFDGLKSQFIEDYFNRYEPTNLGPFISVIRGVSYKPADIKESAEDGVTILRSNNISDGEINYDDLVYVSDLCVSQKQYLRSGDIVMCGSNGSKKLVGKAGLFSGEHGNTSFGAFCLGIRCNDNLSPEYLNAYFNSDMYRSIIEELGNGTNIINIRPDHITSLEIPIPNIEAQKRFVSMSRQADKSKYLS